MTAESEVGAAIVADTVFQGARITTFEVNVPLHTWVHILTHRMFSRNAQSNRAIPTARLVKRASYTPSVFRRNRRGMKGGDEFTGVEDTEVRHLWEQAKAAAHGFARVANGLGVHKEVANRLLAPFLLVRGLITATEWDNFFKLRCDSATQDDTKDVACLMRALLEENVPVENVVHTPYASWLDCFATDDNFDLAWTEALTEACNLSAARCARVSYLNHDGGTDSAKDLELAARLLKDGHLSPFEHPCLWTGEPACANLRGGWSSYRTHLERSGRTP